MKKFLSFLIVITATISMSAADKVANYIFYFIGDGMGVGATMATLNQNDSLLMTQFPVASLCTTYSASSPVTDSAAAGTALSTGHKTINGMLGVAPDSTAVESVARFLQSLGYGVGIITSVAVDDATPGAFYAHSPSRGDYYTIGKQAATSGYEFFAGAGLRGLKDKKTGKPTDLADIFARYKYDIVRGLDAFRASTAQNIVLLNTDTVHTNSIGYAIEAKSGDMTLRDMTRAGMDHLLRVSPSQFFMMVEGGAIDHAGHANDAATVMADVNAFNDALAEAWNFYLAHPDETLIIVTADHDTGGLTVGNTAMGYTARLDLLKAQKMSKHTMTGIIKNMTHRRRIYGFDDILAFLRENLGLGDVVEMTPDDIARLEAAYRTVFIDRNGQDIETLYDNFDPLTQTSFEVLDSHTGAGWTTIHHSGNPVPVFAAGVGAEEFGPMIDNTMIPVKIKEIIGKYQPVPPLMH